MTDGTIDFREIVYVSFKLDDPTDPDGIVAKFVQFTMENNIFGPRGGGGGRGQHVGFYDAEHKDAIEAWLTEHQLWPPTDG